MREHVRNSEAVRDFLVLQVLETTLVIAITAITSSVVFAAADLLGLGGIVITAAWLVAITGAVLVLRIAGDAIAIARAVHPQEDTRNGSA